MVQLSALRSLASYVLVLGSIVVLTCAPASARTHRGSHHHHHHHHSQRDHHRHHAHRTHHHGRHHYAHHGSHTLRIRDSEDRAQRQSFGSKGSVAQESIAPTSFGSSNIVSAARRYIGGNPTGRGSLWCARFMNLVLQRTGHRGTGSDMARSFASYGHRVSGPQVGAIAVMGRRGGGHVGVVSGIDPHGNPIVVSGNHNHRVGESVYPRGRIYAYVIPTS